jgi:hypothetical protein
MPADEEHRRRHERARRPAPAFLSGFNKITSIAALLGARLYFNLIQHYTQNMLRVAATPKISALELDVCSNESCMGRMAFSYLMLFHI